MIQRCACQRNSFLCRSQFFDGKWIFSYLAMGIVDTELVAKQLDGACVDLRNEYAKKNRFANEVIDKEAMP